MSFIDRASLFRTNSAIKMKKIRKKRGKSEGQFSTSGSESLSLQLPSFLVIQLMKLLIYRAFLPVFLLVTITNAKCTMISIQWLQLTFFSLLENNLNSDELRSRVTAEHQEEREEEMEEKRMRKERGEQRGGNQDLQPPPPTTTTATTAAAVVRQSLSASQAENSATAAATPKLRLVWSRRACLVIFKYEIMC